MAHIAPLPLAEPEVTTAMGRSRNFQKPASFPCLPAELTSNSASPYLSGDPKPPRARGLVGPRQH